MVFAVVIALPYMYSGICLGSVTNCDNVKEPKEVNKALTLVLAIVIFF